MKFCIRDQLTKSYQRTNLYTNSFKKQTDTSIQQRQTRKLIHCKQNAVARLKSRLEKECLQPETQ